MHAIVCTEALNAQSPLKEYSNECVLAVKRGTTNVLAVKMATEKKMSALERLEFAASTGELGFGAEKTGKMQSFFFALSKPISNGNKG